MADGTADVVVIGGGVNGVSIAMHLAKRGAGKVVLVEKGHLMEGQAADHDIGRFRLSRFEGGRPAASGASVRRSSPQLRSAFPRGPVPT